MRDPFDPHAFFERASDLLGVANTGHDAWVAVNPRFTQVLGWDQDYFLSTSLLSLVHPDDAPLVRNALAALERTGSLTALECRMCCRGRTHRCISWNATTAPDEGLTYWIGRDVTERAATERALRHNESLYRELVQSSNSAIIRWRADGAVTFFNDRAQSIFGYTPEEVLGQHVDVLVPEQESTGKDLSGLVADIAAHPDRYREHVNENIARDGRRLWMLWTNRPIHDDQGHVVEMLAIGSDVTQLKTTEEALRENESRLKTALEVAALGSWEYDPTTGLTRGDARCAEMYGTAPNEAWTLEHLGTVTHPDDRSSTGGRVMAALAAAEPFTVEYRVLRQDGSSRRIIVSGKPVGNGTSDGLPFERYIGTVMDVTERRHAEEQQRREDERKDRFLATLAHELRNPLAPLRSGLDVLRLAPDEPATRQRVLDLMERQMAHLVRLVDDLLEVSRIKQGKVRLHIQTCDLRDVVSQAVADSPAKASGDRRIEIILPDEPVHVRCDEVRLAQVFQNLLSNARKYTFDQGRIWIESVRWTDRVQVSVRDDGVGIPAEELDEIFEPFHQVSQGTHGGLGIGLTLVRDLVQLFGGTVQAYSQGIGHGSTFSVTLPLAGRHTEAPAPDAQMSTTPASVIRRVLVVDDNPDVVESLAMLLGTMGAAVETAADGRAALQRVDEFRPHVVLLDIGMPNMDGYAVAAAIRSRSHDHAPLLVALTGWGSEADKARSMAAGFDEHLTKPVDAEVLHRLLAR